MVCGAEGLPVSLIPEEQMIASMWCDVIHHVGRYDVACFHAHTAEGMGVQVAGACLVPGPRIASLLGACSEVRGCRHSYQLSRRGGERAGKHKPYG